ncbi:response regulator transcription factor [Roseivirga sp. BDSF3-8]|uniref:response regulator transcription factor n=1 Tax=Roseivirga sp. BDSF3-8 TaxID=3241598 RepID=UPI003531F4D3
MITSKHHHAFDPAQALGVDWNDQTTFTPGREAPEGSDTFVYHFTTSEYHHSKATHEVEGLTKLEQVLHPKDINGVHTLLGWIQETCTRVMSGIETHMYFTLGVRIWHRQQWVRRYLVFEPQGYSGRHTQLAAWLVPGGADSNPLHITNREQEVLALIAAGYSNKQVADMLCISIHTAINHRKHLIEKFQVKNTAQMVCEAGRRRMV